MTTRGLLLNRAKANTTTPGTGTITLGSTVSPFQSWSAAGAVNGRTYAYLIEDGAAWELGTGVYSTTGPTLTRTPTETSAGTTSPLSLSGNATVACIERVEEMGPPPVTTLKKTTGQSCANGTWTLVTWDTTPYLDDVGAFSSGSPTIMTVPSGFSRVRMSGQSIWTNSGSWTSYLQCDCSRAVGPGGATAVAVDIITGNNEHGFHWISPWLTGLVAGDTFSIQVIQTSGAALNFSPAAGFTQAWWQAEWAK